MAFKASELKSKDIKTIFSEVEAQKKVDKNKDAEYNTLIIKELVRSIGRLESRVKRLEERLK